MSETVISNQAPCDLTTDCPSYIQNVRCVSSQKQLKNQQNEIKDHQANNVIIQLIEKQQNNSEIIQNNNIEFPLKRVKSNQQLEIDFKENEKILASLSFNIEDLFKKINSLTEQVKSEIGSRPIASAGSLDKIQSPRRKIQPPAYHSLTIIPIEQPLKHSIQKTQEIILSIKQSNQITIRMFDIGQSLGYGKFGEVFQCRHKQTGAIYALKKIFKSTVEQYSMHEQFIIQLESCKRMNHPNIIKTYTAFTDQFHIFILTQYALGYQLTKKFNSTQQYTSKIIYQVLQALKHMHSQGVVHRDLKPENIIIDSAGIIKICDFGWANLIQKEQKMKILCGTLDYVSPEMVKQEQYTKQVDLWSVGVLTYELIFGVAPFKMESKTATFQRVKKLQYIFPGSYRFSVQCIDFITKLLKPQKERMRLQGCLNHPFIVNNQKNQAINLEYEQLFE